MLNITHYQRNAIQNHNEVPFHASQNGCDPKSTSNECWNCWWECKLVQTLWRTVWRFLKKLEAELPYDPDEWIRKLWYIYPMEYYSAFKKNTFESVLMRLMKLDPIIQSEVSQKEKTPIQYTNACIWNLER